MPHDVTALVLAIKNLSYVAAFIVGVEYLGFNPEALTILVVLMLIDIFMGICRVYIVEGGQAIKSSILKKGVLAKMLLLTGLFSVGLAAQGFGLGLQEFSQGVISVLLLGELYSILGNIHSCRTGEKKVEFDAVVWMLGKVKRLLDKLIS